MNIHLFKNKDGTSSGFTCSKENIVMVYRDQMALFPNDDKGRATIEQVLGLRKGNENNLFDM